MSQDLLATAFAMMSGKHPVSPATSAVGLTLALAELVERAQ
jgi:hypothetical protein